MHRVKRMLPAIIAIVALLAGSGCVAKKMYRQSVEETNERISGVESGVEQNERRISDLREDTDSKVTALEGRVEQAVEVSGDAMSQAQQASTEAERALRGRLLWEVTLSDDRVRFSFNQAELSDEAKTDLDTLAGKIKSLDKAVYVEIEGHTDSIGSAEYNLELGEKRAETALMYLNSSGGLPLHAMNTISYGASRPVADNGTPEGRAQNRRVVVRVLE